MTVFNTLHIIMLINSELWMSRCFPFLSNIWNKKYGVSSSKESHPPLFTLFPHGNQTVVCTVAPKPAAALACWHHRSPLWGERNGNISCALSVCSAAARRTGVLGKSICNLIKAAALPFPRVFHLCGLKQSLCGPTPPMRKEQRLAHWRCAESFDVLKIQS